MHQKIILEIWSFCLVYQELWEGGIRMNSGCFGSEFKDILLSVQAIDRNGKVLTIPSSNIKFEYRKMI